MISSRKGLRVYKFPNWLFSTFVSRPFIICVHSDLFRHRIVSIGKVERRCLHEIGTSENSSLLYHRILQATGDHFRRERHRECSTFLVHASVYYACPCFSRFFSKRYMSILRLAISRRGESRITKEANIHATFRCNSYC